MRTHEYLVNVELNSKNVYINSYFIIKAIPVTKEQAQKISEILYPDFKNVKVINVEKI